MGRKKPKKKSKHSVERNAEDAQLFFVDKVPNPRNRKLKTTPASDKVRLSATELAKARVLGVEAAVEPNSMIPAPYKSIRPAQPLVKESAVVKRLRKRLASQMDNNEEPSAKRARKANNSKAAKKSDDSAYDLWAGQKSKKRGAAKRPKVSRKSETLKAKVLKDIPAVMPPLNGESVNPKFSDYADLAAATAQHYEDDERKEREKTRALKHHTQGRANAESVAERMEVVADEESSEEIESEELSEETKKVLMKSRKPKKKLKKEGLVKKTARLQHAKQVKETKRIRKQTKDLKNIDKIVAELDAEEAARRKRRAQKQKRRTQSAKKQAGIGRNLFVEPDVKLPMPDRVAKSGRLREVANAGASARAVLANFQRRGMSETPGERTTKAYNRINYPVNK